MYLVLLDPSEDGFFGRHWHIVDATSEVEAVREAAKGHPMTTGEAALVIRLAKPATVVRGKVEFEIATSHRVTTG